MFFIDLNVLSILVGLFIWFSFLTLNFLFYIYFLTIYKDYIFKFLSNV